MSSDQDNHDLLARIEALEALAARPPAGSAEPAADRRRRGSRLSRRNVLRGAGLAAAAAALGSEQATGVASAANGDSMILGVGNQTSSPTELRKFTTGTTQDQGGPTLQLRNGFNGAPLNLVDDAGQIVPFPGDIWNLNAFLFFCWSAGLLATIYDSSWAAQPLLLAEPFRVLDTRQAAATSTNWGRSRITNAAGKLDAAGRLRAGQTITLRLNDFTSLAYGVTGNLTVTGGVGAGFLTAWASGRSRPDTSVLNFAAGQAIANWITTPVGLDIQERDAIAIYASQTTHVIFDISGVIAGGFENLASSAAGAQAAGEGGSGPTWHVRRVPAVPER